MAFKKVEEPAAGNFMGWSGSKKGQVVEGTVVEYDEAGGNDYAKRPCPVVTVTLTRKAVSVNKEGERTEYSPGDELSVTCGQANLKKYIKKVDREVGIKRGNGIRIELVGFESVPDGKVKLFEIQVDKDTEADDSDDGHDSGGDDDEPPF